MYTLMFIVDEASRLATVAVGALLVLIYNAFTIISNLINRVRIVLDDAIERVEKLI